MNLTKNRIALAFIGFTFAWCLPSEAQRVDVPPQKQRQAALAQIKDVFADSFQDRSREATNARIKLFLDTGRDSDDSAATQFMLFKTSLDDSKAIGNTKTAMMAISEIAKRFSVSERELKFETLKQLSRSLPDVASANSYLAESEQLVGEFLADDRYSMAVEVLGQMRPVARKGKLENWNDAIKTKSKRVGKLAKEFKNIADDLATLESNPDDPQANLSVGRFYFLEKFDTDKGIELLSKSKASPLAAIASLELQAKKTKQWIAVADQWWDLGTNPPKTIKLDKSETVQIQKHATLIYQRLLKDSKGLQKKEFEKRISEFNSANGGSLLDKLLSQPWRIVWSNEPPWNELRFSASGSLSLVDSKGAFARYSWTRVSPDEISIVIPKIKRTYVLSLSKEGKIVGTKYVTGTSGVSGTGVAEQPKPK